MELADTFWFTRFLDSGTPPIAPPASPFQGAAGTWTYAPVKDGVTTWGIMLIQHYDYE